MAHTGLKSTHEHDGSPMPQNRDVTGDINKDLFLRNLDCAVINYLHNLVKDIDSVGTFNTVRGLFTEGDELYPKSGFRSHTHSQIAVRNTNNIIGYFIPKKYSSLYKELNIS